jgi:hypothetical protein
MGVNPDGTGNLLAICHLRSEEASNAIARFWRDCDRSDAAIRDIEPCRYLGVENHLIRSHEVWADAATVRELILARREEKSEAVSSGHSFLCNEKTMKEDEHLRVTARKAYCAAWSGTASNDAVRRGRGSGDGPRVGSHVEDDLGSG